MSHIVNLFIVLGIVSVFIVIPYCYQMIKWHSQTTGTWAAFEFDHQVKPEDLRFSVLTSNLIIGKQEMPYPVYKKLTHLNASFQQWLLQIPPDKNTRRTYQGSAATVIAPTFRRKICSAFLKLVTSAGLIAIALCNATGINLSTHREISVIMIILISILVRMLYFDAWSASKEGLVVGRLFFKLSIPWSKITAFKIGIPEIDKPGSRRTGFSIHLQSGDKTLEFHDGKFKSIFPVYRAIKTFRPDLKNQCPSR